MLPRLAKPSRALVAARAASSASAAAAPTPLSLAFPAAAAVLVGAAALHVLAPGPSLTAALRACPLPPPATAAQLTGAGLLPVAAAALSLGKAAASGRLGSATYRRLSGGLALWGGGVAAAGTASNRAVISASMIVRLVCVPT